MKTNRSRLERRLARFLALTPPPAAHPATGPPRIDVIYLAEDDQNRLDSCLRE
ncbi:hypothetical protein [Paenarthrobacter aurescens]|uniref:hypothetical protein n=1 Tax=Paenarthrobacter aurescens TaxID=43663 RepID=UPI000AAD8816|nr:hypothetical protein [Paenarthrobacter aurescens]